MELQYNKTPRIDKNLFEDDGHFLGRPADFDDRIVFRRLNLVDKIPGFYGKDLNLVDVGCGNGASMLRLADKFEECVGIDVFESHRKTFEQLRQHFGVNNCSFSVLDLEDDSVIVENLYDRLISFEVIEHLNDDRKVKNFYRMMKPGAKVAISVPNKWWIFETHGAKLPLLPWNRVPFFSWLPTFIHERYANARIYTKARIRKVMEDAGFVVKDIQYITAPMDVLPEGGLKNWLINGPLKEDTTSVPFFATALFVYAEKPE
jgi:2-polyprenyl-3-methyl-5-hydroxy-6-metoxy-1,4-benzoquinol methylase